MSWWGFYGSLWVPLLLVYAAFMIPRLPRRLRPARELPRDLPDVLTWRYTVEMHRAHYRRIIADFPPREITIDRQRREVTFANCFFPDGGDGQPEPSHTCDLDAVQHVYLSWGNDIGKIMARRGLWTTILTKEGRATMPDCGRLACREEADLARNYFASKCDRAPQSPIRRLPNVRTMRLISLIFASVLIVLTLLFAFV